MTTPVYFDDDADLAMLAPRTVAVIGYGDQGAAQAMSLRDSGVKVVMGLPPTSVNRARAADEGLSVGTPAEAAAAADIVVLLAPLALQRFVYDQALAPALTAGKALLLPDGFPIRYGLITPPDGVDIMLLTPLADGAMLRRQFQAGKGVPALVAVERDASGSAWPLLLAYAKAVGVTRAGARATTFAAQAEAYRFGEQVVGGGVQQLVGAGFEALTGAGLSSDVAYLAVVQQLKVVVDALAAGGLAAARAAQSEVARFGADSRGSRVLAAQLPETLRELLAELRDGTFVKEWLADEESGRPAVTAADAAAAAHPIEPAGTALRATMPWLG